MGDLISSLVGGAVNIGGMALQNYYNKQMYEQQYRDSIDFYQMQLADSRQNTADERAYNAPSAEAARMRAAGLNPDLQGVTSPASSAASTPVANVPVQQPTQVSNFLPAISLGMEQFIDFASKIQDLRAKRLANRDAEIGVVDDWLTSVFSKYDLEVLSKAGAGDLDVIRKSMDDGKLSKNFSKLLSDDLGYDGGTINSAGISAKYTAKDVLKKGSKYLAGTLPKSQIKRLQKLALQRVKSLSHDVYKMDKMAKLTSDTYTTTKNVSSPGYNTEGNVDESLQKVLQDTMDLQLALLRNQKDMSDTQKDIMKNEKDITDAESVKRKNEQVIYDWLEKMRNSEDKWERMAGVFFGIVFLTMQNSSFSRSSGPKGATTSFGF